MPGALLVKNEIVTQSHSECIQKFGQHFIQTGKISKDLDKHYSELFDKRHKGDYNDLFDFDEETVMGLLEPSRELIKKIEELLIESSD